jgi:hypothetical protein
VSEAVLKALGIATCGDLIAQRGLLGALFSDISTDFFMEVVRHNASQTFCAYCAAGTSCGAILCVCTVLPDAAWAHAGNMQPCCGLLALLRADWPGTVGRRELGCLSCMQSHLP